MIHEPSDHSVYVHLPFCVSRCHYCDFATGVFESIPFDRYARKVIEEIRRRRALLGLERPISVYVGGGTPSLWPALDLVKILSACGDTGDAEVTVEANPGDADPEWFKELADAGVNRFSIGVQALEPRRLEWMGRRHGVEEAAAAVAMALGSGAGRVSADIIYGTPGQRPRDLEAELGRIADMGVDHVSAYELTVAAGTALGRRVASGEVSLPDEAAMIELWETAGAVLDARGLRRYEVSSHAADGSESVHNRHYWRGGAYLGAGAGAHGYAVVDGEHARWSNAADPLDYMAGAAARVEILSPLDRARELLMLGLRAAEGVDFDGLAGGVPDEVARRWGDIVADLIAEGHVVREGGRLIPTDSGMLMADGIAELFF